MPNQNEMSAMMSLALSQHSKSHMAQVAQQLLEGDWPKGQNVISRG